MKHQIGFYRLLIVTGLLLLMVSALAQSPAYAAPQDEIITHQPDPSQARESFIGSTKIDPGTIVRVRMNVENGFSEGVGPYLEGRFQSFKDGILAMSIDGSEVSIPSIRIYQFKVRTGGGGGAWVGGIMGLVIGGVIVAATQPDRSDESFGGLDNIGEDIARGSVIVLAGVAVGASIGASRDSGKWKSVALENQTFGLLGQNGSGYRLTYSLRF